MFFHGPEIVVTCYSSNKKPIQCPGSWCFRPVVCSHSRSVFVSVSDGGGLWSVCGCRSQGKRSLTCLRVRIPKFVGFVGCTSQDGWSLVGLWVCVLGCEVCRLFCVSLCIRSLRWLWVMSRLLGLWYFMGISKISDWFGYIRARTGGLGSVQVCISSSLVVSFIWLKSLVFLWVCVPSYELSELLVGVSWRSQVHHQSRGIFPRLRSLTWLEFLTSVYEGVWGCKMSSVCGGVSQFERSLPCVGIGHRTPPPALSLYVCQGWEISDLFVIIWYGMWGHWPTYGCVS